MKLNRTEDVIQDEEQDSCQNTERNDRVEFLHSGSTLINLALSQKNHDGGWARGRVINIVGDGSSGKTLAALELCARTFHFMPDNISVNFPRVKKVKIRYNNTERVMDMPLEKMYGKDFASSVDWGTPSETVEDFGMDFYHRVKEHKDGDLLLYIVDSWDDMTSSNAKSRWNEAMKKEKEIDDSYGAGPEKAKWLSEYFWPNVVPLINGKDITLIIISQIRETLGNIMYGKKYKRNGGKTFDFQTHQVAWFYEQEKLQRQIQGEKKPYGIRTLVRVERNKTAKPFRSAEQYILFDYGFDDVTTNLAYLYGPKVESLEWDGIKYDRRGLILYIEANNLQEELSNRTADKWNKVENVLVRAVEERVPRY